MATIAGAVFWAVLWVGGTMAAGAVWPTHIASDRSVSDAGALALYIAYSVVLSVGAGYVAARVGGGANGARAVAILAGVQLLLGIGVEVSSWSLTPVWYHLVFLALLVPATLYGGRLRAGSAVEVGTRYAAG